MGIGVGKKKVGGFCVHSQEAKSECWCSALSPVYAAGDFSPWNGVSYI